MHKSLHAESYRSVFLELLRQSRAAADLTQLELAAKLGVDRTVVTKAELGHRRLDLIETYEWASCLEIDFVEFARELEQRLIALKLRDAAVRERPK